MAALATRAIVASLLSVSGAAAESLSAYSVVRESTSNSISLFKDLTVACPEGTDVLSGGYRIIGLAAAGIRPQANRPTPDGKGWYALVRWSVLSSWSLEVTAVCGLVEDRVQISDTIPAVANTFKQLEVECDGEALALGGGAEVAGSLGTVYMTSWGVQGVASPKARTFASTIDSGAWSLTVHLICGNVPNYNVRSDFLQGAASNKNLNAVCTGDRVPVGGGLTNGQLTLEDAAFTESTLSLDGLGWLASIRDFGTDEFWTATSTVVCAPEPSASVLASTTIAAVAFLGGAFRRRGCRERHASSRNQGSLTPRTPTRAPCRPRGDRGCGSGRTSGPDCPR
jgi:hypothetical protein